jgi:hypothetical protein
VSYLSFVASSVLIGSRRLLRLDVLSGFVLSRLKRARWVFNVSDLWPESAVVLDVLGSGPLTRLGYRLEGVLLQTFLASLVSKP